jgi:hypothetical protein
MRGRGVLVHCLSRLGAAATVLAAKVPRRDRVFTEWAVELGEAVHHLDRVMSHSFNCRRSSLARLRTKVSPERSPDGEGDCRKIAISLTIGVLSVNACFRQQSICAEIGWIASHGSFNLGETEQKLEGIASCGGRRDSTRIHTVNQSHNLFVMEVT